MDISGFWVYWIDHNVLTGAQRNVIFMSIMSTYNLVKKSSGEKILTFMLSHVRVSAICAGDTPSRSSTSGPCTHSSCIMDII